MGAQIAQRLRAGEYAVNLVGVGGEGGVIRQAIVASLALTWCGAAFAQAPPVEAYGRLPAVSDVAISPDGRQVALAVNTGAVSSVQVVDIDRGEALAGATVEDNVRLRGVRWSDDERVIMLLSRTFRPTEVLPANVYFRGSPRRVDYYRNGVFHVPSRRIEVLSTSDSAPWADRGASLIAPIEGDPGYGRMIGWARNGFPTVYRISLSGGSARAVTPRGANGDTQGFLLDRDGTPVTRIDADPSSNRWRLFAYDEGMPRLLFEDVSNFGQPLSVAGLLPDGRLAVFDYDDASEFYVLYAVNRQSGERELLFAREGYEIEGALIDPWTRQVVGATWIENERSQHYFDPMLQSVYDQVSSAFPTGAASIVSWSRDRSRVIVYGERGLDGGGYYLFKPAENTLQRLAMLYPELQGVNSGERLSISYRARDGQSIPAYLTLPPGQIDARGLPLVLLVHGGPASRDTLDFDYMAAFFASRGYAVLQPNFRGSSGYGSTWERAGWRQWGGVMQTDVEDGVAALIRSGRVDPERVCIVGGSYGGYAALAGATLTPERYSCAISINGVSDLEEMLRTERLETGSDSITSDYWQGIIGDGREDRDAIRAVSPAFLAERAQAPILLIHATDDTVVRIDQSRRMQRALEAAGKPVRFVELRGDDHFLSDAETRIETLREMESFLAQHLRQ